LLEFKFELIISDQQHEKFSSAPYTCSSKGRS